MKITLPDGSVRKLEAGANGFDLANNIGPGLAKAAIAVSVNGIQKDLCDPKTNITGILAELCSLTL